MVHELRLASFFICCLCGRNVTVVVHLRCRPTMVINMIFSICVGIVVGETFSSDTITNANGGSFTYSTYSSTMLVAIHFY